MRILYLDEILYDAYTQEFYQLLNVKRVLPNSKKDDNLFSHRISLKEQAEDSQLLRH